MRMLIKNGRVIDPASNTDDIRDILVEDGVIAEVAKDIDKAADTVIDAKGCMVMPGPAKLTTRPAIMLDNTRRKNLVSGTFNPKERA